MMSFAVLSTENTRLFESYGDCYLAFDDYPTVNWDGKSNLPIDVLQAKSIFETWAGDNMGRNSQSSIVHFKLAKVVTEESFRGYWVYIIRYVVFMNGKPAEPFNRHLAIDMSGKVIESNCET